jgi:tape measure domain-containing protein
MTDLVARLRIEANATQATGTVVQFSGALGGARNQAAAAARSFEETGNGARNLEGRLRGAQGAASLLGTAIGYMGLRALVAEMSSAAQASAGMSIGLGAVAGGAAGAKAELGFIRDEATRLGIGVREASQSFLGLAGATNGTVLAGQQTREIWLGVSEAGMAMGRSNEEVKRGLEAVSQIASKGVVSMEEIRQQLAEAIPGATNIAARAMGMTTAEFNKTVAAGKLLSSEFLPKFAAQLRSEFGPAVDKYLNTDVGKARVELGKLKTDLFDLSAIGGEAFLGGVVSGLSDLHRELTDQETRDAARELGRELGALAGAGAKGLGELAQNADKVAIALGVLVGLRGGAALAAMGAEALAA